MNRNDFIQLLEAEELVPMKTGAEIRTAFSSDMLSDVLALPEAPDLLITGLLNPQVIRTAEMLDTSCVLFVSDKRPCENILSLAREKEIGVMCTSLDTFASGGLLYKAGVRSVR